MSYSDGGALTLSSPTHGHHIDVTNVARTIRHSLSRSPSKFRLITKSPSPSPQSPLSPSPPKRQFSLSSSAASSGSAPNTPSPLVPFPPSAKLALRSSSRSKVITPRSASRTRTSPKSPMKRALSQTSDTGNIPSSSQSSIDGQENNRTAIPSARKSFERMAKMTDSAGPVNYALSRLGGDGANDSPMGSSISSPLKRSDTLMNLDQASLGSPVAKRRSLHGSATFGSDFNVFDHGPPTSNFDIHDDTPNNEYELAATSITADSSIPSFTSMPRRSSSLRKSTLQQRHDEKTSWGRRRAAAQALLAQHTANAGPSEISTPTQTKNRPRLSLDQFVAPLPRDSPFSSQGNLPNPSAHLMHLPPHNPHPLSRTMTTSSSSGSIVDESPTHIPVNFGEKPKAKLDFSKSLPPGALRPFMGFESMQENALATPQNSFRSVKPLPAAFGSTGLISKMNKNPEEPRITRGKAIPDTPCKKQVNVFATYPAPIPGSALQKARHVRHSFGTPSTPFNLHGNTPSQHTFGQGSGVFGGGPFLGRGMARRGSFLSIDGDELGESPDAKMDSQSSNDFDMPPTPTKQTLAQEHFNGSPSHHRSFPPSALAFGYGLGRKTHQRKSSKLNPFTSPSVPENKDSDGSPQSSDNSPCFGHGGRIRKRSADGWGLMSSTASDRVENMVSPTPGMPRSNTSLFLDSSTKHGFAKFSRVAPASPLDRIDFFDRITPQTPQDNILPPDPSGLSISNHREVPTSKTAPMLPPATPTAGRDLVSFAADRRLSTTPINSLEAPDIDESLKSRFDKIELVGSGVFSQVYRVSKVVPRAPLLIFNKPANNSRSQSPTSTLEQVFAVKKSRQPFQGLKDRSRKLQEVYALKKLGKSDHVVAFFDSWEFNNHLYIQTEYCEEGSLDIFLAQAGKKGRLDDFRIWKIALELGKGLKHIHDTGFIHLDLKPANILVTFEGVLKIADFGLASKWPAPPGHEGEGDREYIGPEILKGDLDKPADIFSFGIIMIEIACNVSLPDNGESWTKLRSGDVSDAPSLTWSNDSLPPRDATGMVIDEDSDTAMDTTFGDDSFDVAFGSPTLSTRRKNALGSAKSLSHDASNLFGTLRRGELHKAPPFMKDSFHDWSLDKLAVAMINPNPELRPPIDQVLQAGGLRWVEPRRRAGATVFEGDYGPADEVLAVDSEMMDV